MSKEKGDSSPGDDEIGAPGLTNEQSPRFPRPADAPPAPPPLHGLALTVVAVALAAGTFMQVLDSTIANVSLPTIAGNLGESTDKGTWVITAFAVANGVTVPLTGWLMRRFGIVTVFTASVALFTLASFLCGIAWSLPSLIAFRLLQGAVSGPMIPGSQTLMLAVFPPEKRSVALTIWSVTALVGPVAGPLFGGYISDHFHWGWIFLINVPVGIITVVTLLARLRPYNTPALKIPLDVMGVAILIIWVGALQLVLDLGKKADWFSSPMICVLAVISGVGFVAWVIWELTDRHPAVDLTLFARRNYALGTLTFFLGYALFFGNMVLMPLWLQQEQGYTATWAGLVAAPAGVVAIILAPPLTRLSNHVDLRWMATLSYGSLGLSFLMRASFTTGTDFYHFVLPMLMQGVGVSIFFTAIISISLDGIEPHRIAAATGLSNFARITGGGFAASIITTMWDRREALHQTRLVEQTTATNPAFLHALHHLGALGLNQGAASATIMREITQQAYLLAATDLFRVTGWLCLGMIALVWLAKRPAPPNGPVAAD